MFLQLLIGSIVISISILIEAAFIFVALAQMSKLRTMPSFTSNYFILTICLTALTLWLLAAFSLVTWIWALTLFGLESFESLEQALYFSMVAFTSLGFGDVVLGQEWRILSGMIAANGLLLFGLNTAILVEALREMLKAGNRL